MQHGTFGGIGVVSMGESELAMVAKVSPLSRGGDHRASHVCRLALARVSLWSTVLGREMFVD